jgi:phytoene dehydrogenase-like protein
MDRLDLADFPGQFLTVTTLKDPSKKKGSVHTLESFVFVSHEAFAKWAHSRYGERPDDYKAMKEELTAKMLRNVERIIPGAADRVVFKELGTPLTNEHYVMATKGNLYGTEKSRWQVGPFGWPVRTEVAGLYMVGASTLAHGVMGAAMSGMAAAGMALRCRGRDLLRPSQQKLRLLPCDDPAAWPVELRPSEAGAPEAEDAVAAG